jgi:DNA ligase 1
MFSAWINQLKSTDSRNEKEEIIRSVLSMSMLGCNNSTKTLEYLKDCYNPYITYGIKKISDTEDITDGDNPVNEFDQILDKLIDRSLSGNAAIDAIDRISRRFDSEEWNGFFAPLLRRDMRCGISVKTLNNVLSDTPYKIPLFECQLAKSGDDRPEMIGIKWLEPKFDGCRMLVKIQPKTVNNEAEVTCYSRNGQIFDNFKHIEKQLLDNLANINFRGNEPYFLDGEVTGKSFQTLMTQARRKTEVQNDDSIFNIFDYIPVRNFEQGYWNAQLFKRKEHLDMIAKNLTLCPNISILPIQIVNLDTDIGKQEMTDYANKIVADGYEGIMIKDPNAPYSCSRSTAWMKYKPTITVDLTVIDIEEGDKKNVGKMGALVCSGTDDGKLITVNVGSGFDDQQRAQIWADFTNKPVSYNKKAKKEWQTFTEQPSGIEHVGRIVEILADAVTQNQDGSYSLRFPRFVRFRDDKA